MSPPPTLFLSLSVNVSARAARQPVTRPSANARAPRRSREWCTVQSRSRPRAHPPPWASSLDRCRGAPRCARPCSTVPRFPTASLLLKNGQKKSKKFKFLYCFLIFFLAPHRPTSGPVPGRCEGLT